MLVAMRKIACRATNMAAMHAPPPPTEAVSEQDLESVPARSRPCGRCRDPYLHPARRDTTCASTPTTARSRDTPDVRSRDTPQSDTPGRCTLRSVVRVR
ncbi:hypothetical protein T484DRAFT_2795074 [Baffinella frigidus]|nr:hypothetical protein T484DRAFT_2795074 [Cryptophyta sp. CCMP2293]